MLERYVISLIPIIGIFVTTGPLLSESSSRSSRSPSGSSSYSSSESRASRSSSAIPSSTSAARASVRVPNSTSSGSIAADETYESVYARERQRPFVTKLTLTSIDFHVSFRFCIFAFFFLASPPGLRALGNSSSLIYPFLRSFGSETLL